MRKRLMALGLIALGLGILLAASGIFPLALVYPGGSYTVYVTQLEYSKSYFLSVVFRERIPMTPEEAAECNMPDTGYYVTQPLFTGTIKVYQDNKFVAEVPAVAVGTVGDDSATIDFKSPSDSPITIKLPALHSSIEEAKTVLRFELIGYFKGRQVCSDSGTCTLYVKYKEPPETTPEPWWQQTSSYTPSTTITKPSPPDLGGIWSKLQSIWMAVIEWLKTVFGFNINVGSLSVVSGNIIHPGDTFQQTFTLTNSRENTIPDKNYQDGSASFAYVIWMVTDEGGNIVHKGSVSEVSSLQPGATVTCLASWTAENVPDGKYAIVAMLIEIPMHWDDSTQQWMQGKPIIVDKQAVEVNVKSIPPPAAPTDVWGTLQQWLQNLLNWLRSIFGF